MSAPLIAVLVAAKPTARSGRDVANTAPGVPTTPSRYREAFPGVSHISVNIQDLVDHRPTQQSRSATKSRAGTSSEVA